MFLQQPGAVEFDTRARLAASHSEFYVSSYFNI